MPKWLRARNNEREGDEGSRQRHKKYRLSWAPQTSFLKNKHPTRGSHPPRPTRFLPHSFLFWRRRRQQQGGLNKPHQRTCPPTWPAPSKSVTLWPLSAQPVAAASPAGPDPTTATFLTLAGGTGRRLRVVSYPARGFTRHDACCDRRSREGEGERKMYGVVRGRSAKLLG